MKSVYKLHLAPCHRFLKLPTDLDHLRTILSLYVKGEQRYLKYKVNFAVGVTRLLLSQCIRSCLWNTIKPLKCRPHRLSLLLFQMLLCPLNICLKREGKSNCSKDSWAASKWKKKSNKSREELLDRIQDRYHTGKGLACDRNHFCNLKNLAHCCYCCSLYGLLHFSAISMWKQTTKILCHLSKETSS